MTVQDDPLGRREFALAREELKLDIERLATDHYRDIADIRREHTHDASGIRSEFESKVALLSSEVTRLRDKNDAQLGKWLGVAGLALATVSFLFTFFYQYVVR
jgi:hypothetical protein